MKTEQLANFQHDNANGTKLVRATEFTRNDGQKDWRVCVIVDKVATWSSPGCRAEAIEMAEAAIASMVEHLNELYNGD